MQSLAKFAGKGSSGKKLDGGAANNKIQEAKNEKIKTIPIVKNLIQDFEILKQKAVKIKEESEKQSDYATSALIDNFLANYSKKLWMLNETIK